MQCPNCWQSLTESESKFCQVCGIRLADWERYRPSNAATINTLALTKTPLTLGRGNQNDIRLDHPAVSERHARLEWRPATEAWFVVDEGSARGTYLNYQQVPRGSEGLAVTSDSDTIWIAPYSFQLAKGEHEQQRFEPAHLRLHADGLIRTVRVDKDRQTLTILNLDGTPLSFRPGEFIALVGGSGAGKTTLMKALLGLETAQDGIVYLGTRPFIVDGRVEQFEAMHTVIGYVPQDDVVHRNLTAMEAMDYVARFRLSPDLSPAERLVYIRQTLETVELWPHREKLISKLSGGQRKRVNIALELLARPRLLFLDEPTSGLDPGLDLSIMELLHHWATDPQDPRTIILVTHATENVTLCKYVAFMATGGHVVYFGPPADALTYFSVDRFAEIYRYIGQFHPPNSAVPASGTTQSLVTAFEGSTDHFRYVEMRHRAAGTERPLPPSAAPAQASEGRPGREPLDWSRLWLQFRTLTVRYWKLIRRDRMNFVILLLQGLLVAGLLWAVAPPDTFQPKGAENAQTVLFIMACAAAWLGILNGTKEIVKEQDIYLRERRYGLQPSPYVLSKLAVLAMVGAIQVATMLLVISRHVVLPSRGALAPWSPAWFEWFITLELCLTAGLAMGLFLSASTKTIDAATAIMFVLLLIQVMFAGLFFPDAAWADILSVFTFSRWSLEGLGTTANLNGLLKDALGSVYKADPAYTFSALHLIGRWVVLGAYGVLFGIGATWRQARKR